MLAVLAGCSSPHYAGAGPIYLDGKIEYLRAATAFRYALLPENASVRDALSHKDYRPIRSAYPNFGLQRDALWLVTEVHADTEIPFILEVASPQLRKIEFYQLQNGEIIARGEGSAGSSRDHPYFRFPLVQNGSPSKILIRMVSADALTIPIYLWNEVTLRKTDLLRHLGFGAFFGLMLSLSIYNFFIFVSTRDRAYLYYVTYILGFGIFLSVVYGYQAYFIPLQPYHFQVVMAPLFSIITSMFALLFSHGFLLIRDYSRMLSRVCIAVISVGGLLLLIVPFLETRMAILVANVYPMVTVFLVTANIVLAWKSGFKPARYFALAWSFLLLSVVYFVAGNLGVVTGSFLSHYGSIFGASLEATLLSLALGYRINDLREKQEEAQKQIVEEQKKALELQEKYTESFRRFVPDQFLHYLKKESILEVNRGDSIQSEMTVLFSDLRDFTEFSENAGEELVFHFLNLYLEQMQPIIQKYGGFIDKFIGDAIMALFPDPEKAVLASADMILELRSMQNQSNIPESEDKALQLMESGCGLHHGSLMLGTVGSSDRLETTVIGDTVNMASRLESLNKTLGTRILISRSVQQRISSDSQLQDWIRQIGTWHIRGKSEPQAIFEVFAADPPALRSYKSRTRDEMESIASMLVQSRSDTGLRRALRERMEVQLASVPAGFQDGPAQYLMTQLSGEATSKS
tara:strand:- start:16100 stop:18166 length:2067 start_codon:yes stop_codon:yes gene_type:complete